MIYYISGGARSGKSSFAQRLALNLSDTPVYLATSRIWDNDHQARIERHQADRDERWTNIEEEKYLSKHDFEGRVVLLDCVTLWLTNFYMDHSADIDRCLQEAKDELNDLFAQKADFIIVSNELGMGLHADTELGRKFVDLQGWVNQYIASRSHKAFFMVSGLPLCLK
ncbi:MAG: bifunctional adenosylcobinamide kinase/adenosylcobinamide-phosphate guanylyltransferase [Cyclobacteriaceae bacterium]|nr:bifunctional adenosylcobinamide kinase/adenosylcobinamide-phosphate guanylyltransferase [Cyclobacteriaceae bacterium]